MDIYSDNNTENQRLLEAQVLFSAISNPSFIDILLNLEEEDFLYYQNVFKAIKKAKKEGKTIDYILIYSLEKKTKEAVLLALSEDNMGQILIPHKEIFEERVKTLAEASIKNKIKQSYINELDLNVLKENLEKIHRNGGARWLTSEDIKNIAHEILKEKKQNSVNYGLSLLDKATGGIEKGQYIIVAGRPSIGKSAFLQFIGLHNAEKGKKVLFVSAEMGEEMIVSRILTTYKPSNIPENFNILIASSILTIESEIQRKARDFDLVLIDYIQLLKPKIKTRDLYERVTYVSGDLKEIATKFNLPLVCASQFSRKAEGNQPNLADLKESGALEQDADIVISLWRDKDDDELLLDDTLSTVRVDLLKNRNGQTFINTETKTYALMFKKSEFRFFEKLSV